MSADSSFSPSEGAPTGEAFVYNPAPPSLGRCTSTHSFGDMEVAQCAREPHGVEQPPYDRMIYHRDASGTRRWSEYPRSVYDGRGVAPDTTAK